jgi:hypothetical protein
LSLDTLTIDRAFINPARIEGNVIADVEKVSCWFGVPPRDARNALLSDNEVGVVSYSLELTHGRAWDRLKKLHPAVFARKIIRRRVGRFEDPKSAGGVADDFPAVADNDVLGAGLQSRWARIVPY